MSSVSFITVVHLLTDSNIQLTCGSSDWISFKIIFHSCCVDVKCFSTPAYVRYMSACNLEFEQPEVFEACGGEHTDRECALKTCGC